MGQAAGGLGSQLEDRYFRQKVKLGQGSFGTVWRAVDRKTGETVAIKQLDKVSMPRRGVTPEDVKRETNLMRVCRHENITQVFDIFEDASSIFLALEYCDGGDFGDKLREQGLGMTEPEASWWVRQMCDAVCVLHTLNIVHRDVKPENFMVHNKTMLKLSDFGLATNLPKNQLLQAPCGTPAYNAPEQHRSLRQRRGGYGLPVDVWALGVSMYMVMFGGKHPFLDEHHKLSDNFLLAGKLDFRDRSSTSGFLGLEGVNGSGLRYSEDARTLCKRMMDPDPARRITICEAVYSPWLSYGRHQKCSTPTASTTTGSSGSCSSGSAGRRTPTPSAGRRTPTPSAGRRAPAPSAGRRTPTPMRARQLCA